MADDDGGGLRPAFKTASRRLLEGFKTFHPNRGGHAAIQVTDTCWKSGKTWELQSRFQSIDRFVASSLLEGMNTRTWFQRTYVLCLVWASFALIAAAQADVDWNVTRNLGPSDRKAILEIARRAGIGEPRYVSVPVLSSCALVQVESMRVVEGNRVRSSILGVRQLHGPECPAIRADQRSIRRGNWIAFLGTLNPQSRERWRVRDGSWNIDIDLSADVPYEDAVTIVLAVRRRQLVDARPAALGNSPSLSYVDPNSITSIQTPHVGLVRPATPGEYTVAMTGSQHSSGRAGSGESLTVRVQNGTVELRDHDQVIF